MIAGSASIVRPDRVRRIRVAPCSLAALLIAAGHSSRRIAREATTEVGFGFALLVLRRALKPLIPMLLRRSKNTLRISSVALFCAFFSVGSTPSPPKESNPRQARPARLPRTSAGLTHSGFYAQLPHLPRRDNHSQSIRSIRSLPLARPPRRGGGHTCRPALPKPNCQRAERETPAS
jgi:hypothetical protein